MLNGSSYREALFAISPDVSRADWTKIGMAAKDAGLSQDDWLEWSRGGESFKEQDARSAWRSFKLGKVKAGSLVYMAKAHGWRPEARSPQPEPKQAGLAAQELWGRCAAATDAHPYIIRKGGVPDGLRQCDEALTIAGQNCKGALVVPVRAMNGDLRSLQLIPAEGRKVNLPGHPMDGLHIVGDPSGKVYVVEGIGQAWACWQATGHAAAVSFGAGRMAAIAELLVREGHEVVLVPDVGQESRCRDAAAKHRAGLVCLPDRLGGNGDANDLAQTEGHEALRALLASPEFFRPRFWPMTADELMARPPLSWRIKGVLPAAGVGVVFGASGSGKSFLVLDMLAAVADGRSWFSYRTKPATVVYLGLEGESGLSQRLQALSREQGKPASLRFIATPLDIRDEAERADLIRDVQEAGCAGGVLVVDTLNRAAPAADENSPSDMGAIVAALGAMQRALGGLVLAVHHSGKDSAKGMRGHSSLHAALDVAVEVTNVGGARTWRIAKAKDGADDAEHGFTLRSVLLGLDEDRDPISSCVVEPCESIDARAKREPKGANQRIALEALSEALRGPKVTMQAGRPMLALDAAIEAVAVRLPCDPKRQRERAQTALTGLQGGGFIRHEGGNVWLS